MRSPESVAVLHVSRRLSHEIYTWPKAQVVDGDAFLEISVARATGVTIGGEASQRDAGAGEEDGAERGEEVAAEDATSSVDFLRQEYVHLASTTYRPYLVVFLLVEVAPAGMLEEIGVVAGEEGVHDALWSGLDVEYKYLQASYCADTGDAMWKNHMAFLQQRLDLR